MLQSFNLLHKEGVKSGLLRWMLKLKVSSFDLLYLALVLSLGEHI
uniref:Uncharacterized protein n=1 Tax=Lepeophtheirus salmonis TaxID=72036 RepID=A0A0K2T468_LEPSM